MCTPRSLVFIRSSGVPEISSPNPDFLESVHEPSVELR